MKRLCTVMAVLFVFSRLNAQEAKWTYKGMVGGNYNSTNVTDNWSGAERNSESWAASLDASGVRDSGVSNWATALEERYGRSKVAGSPDNTSNDLIELNSVYTAKVSTLLNPYAGLIIDTQNWQMFRPVVYTESAGDSVWIINKPEHMLKTRAGVALKQTYDVVHQKTDPVTGVVTYYSAADDSSTPQIEQAKHQTGVEWVTNYDVSLSSSARFISEARVFDGCKGGADLRWESNLFVKLSSIITLQLNYLWIYNFENNPQPVWPQDIEKRLSLVVGVAYNLF